MQKKSNANVLLTDKIISHVVLHLWVADCLGVFCARRENFGANIFVVPGSSGGAVDYISALGFSTILKEP